MRYAQRILIITLILLFGKSTTYEKTSVQGKFLTFDELKHFISYYESSNGKFKFHQNSNGTVDCGLYQVNSSHFDIHGSRDTSVSRAVEAVFKKYKVSTKKSERIVEVIRNDSLCYELARTLYEKVGIEQWACYPKFKTLIAGYNYVTMSVLSRQFDRRKSTTHKRVPRVSVSYVSKQVLRPDQISDIQSTKLEPRCYDNDGSEVSGTDSEVQ